MKIIQYLFRLAVVVICLCLLLGYISPYIHPKYTFIPAYLGICFPFIYFIAIICFVLTLFRDRSWSLKLLLPFILLGLFFTSRFMAFSSSTEEVGIDIMSFNVRVGRDISRKKDIRDKQLNPLKEILAEKIDIFCMQEVRPNVIDLLDIKKTYPYTFQVKSNGTYIASKYEILSSGDISFGTRANSCVWVDLKTPDGIMRVYNVHFQSNQITQDTEKAIEESKKYNRKKVLSHIKKILLEYNKHSLKRLEQAVLVKNHMNTCPHPVIVTGDFNETAMNRLYQIISEGMDDTMEKGRGFLSTFPEAYPLFRIDYILTSKIIECHDFEIHRNLSLSDHVPLVSTISINKE